MIAMAAALRLADARRDYAFSVEPRWELRGLEEARAPTVGDRT
jgi:hypothetical protein